MFKNNIKLNFWEHIDAQAHSNRYVQGYIVRSNGCEPMGLRGCSDVGGHACARLRDATNVCRPPAMLRFQLKYAPTHLFSINFHKDYLDLSLMTM